MIVLPADDVHLAQHLFDRVHGLVEVRVRRVLAAEHREVARRWQFARTPREVARERLAEVAAAVRRGAARVLEVDARTASASRSTSIATAPAPCVCSPVLPRSYSATSALTTIASDRRRRSASVAQRSLERVDAAQARVLELGHLAVPRQPRHAERVERAVDHAAHDHGAGGVVGARLGAEAEEADPLRVDVVLADQPQDGVGRHRVDVLVRARHAEAVADDRPDLVPGVAGPFTPRFEVDAIRRDVNGKAAETNLLGHRTPENSPMANVSHGRRGSRRAIPTALPPVTARDYMTNA